MSSRPRPTPLQNFFIYALQRTPPGKLDPLTALKRPLPDRPPSFYNRPKAMWSTPAILAAAGRKIYRTGPDRWVAARTPPPGGQELTLYRFIPARVEVNEKGVTRSVEHHAADPNVRAFELGDPHIYSAVMTSCLRELYRSFPLARKSTDQNK